MPVITPRQLRDDPGLLSFSSFGVFAHEPGATVELHFHDCDEYWIFTRGRVLIRTEGTEYQVGRGDMVFTPMGEEHEFIEVYETVEGVWIEGPLAGKQRHGHLHHPEDD